MELDNTEIYQPLTLDIICSYSRPFLNIRVFCQWLNIIAFNFITSIQSLVLVKTLVYRPHGKSAAWQIGRMAANRIFTYNFTNRAILYTLTIEVYFYYYFIYILKEPNREFELTKIFSINI